LPTLYSEDLLRQPEPEWTGERWGVDGRPVLLLTESGDDRSAWWPVAARLAEDLAVAVLDLPGDGPIGDRAETLAQFVAEMGTRAPVVVGHGRAAVVASLFAARYVAHGVAAVERALDAPGGDADTEAALAEITAGPRKVGCRYLAVFGSAPRPGYAAWLEARIPGAECAVYGTGDRFPHLSDPERFIKDVTALAS
jgi:pimeloyl-ACP methyl ester carboxylesterase